ncbi:MAG: N-acetylmuramoyl-L-alanine amidase [Candidatus Eremiobacteraeota bacterium]|nr:N-acetylmuramoyl-L-alanine amidase [Candidatus Eremiobacteraeota bacterium]
MSLINRFIVPTFSSLAALCAFGIVAFALPARADAPLVATYQGQTIRFTHVETTTAGRAVGVQDPGLATLLHDLGAAMTWKPGDRYALVTTSVPVVVSFAVGDRRYDVGPLAMQASFAPYQRGDEVFLPLDELLHALDLALRQDGAASVLQPQLATLDVRAGGDGVTVVAHGGAPLHPRVVQQSPGTVTYEFDGVGTTLAGTRAVGAGGVRSIEISQSGTIQDPKTLLTAQLTPGSVSLAPRSNDDRDVVLAFSSSSSAPPPPAALVQNQPQNSQPVAAVTPAPLASAAAGPATVTGVTVSPSDQGYTVVIAITGDAQYEWHRLRDPDNRFWVDVKNAQLQGPPVDQAEPDPVNSLRVRQVDPGTVRVALSLGGPKSLAVSPGAGTLTVDVGRQDVADAPRAGNGSVGNVVSTGEETALVTPAPIGESGSEGDNGGDSNWKFGPHQPVYVPTNPKLIVIDPGHGGSDRGAIRGDLSEADVNLDTAKRLKAILIARGWQVQMTHDADVDVYAPNDSAHDELQARCDVANQAGARLLISIHSNSFINSGPYGTTLYVTKAGDVALARAIERHTISDGTKNDGIIKSNMYMTNHTLMPATLIEMAFLSNPSDYALLASAQWRQKIATEMADGIDAYAQANPVPNQPPQ